MQRNDTSDEQNNHLTRLASVGQIAAGIAHEVRNPLTAVKGFLQLLQEQSPHTYLDIAHQELDNAISTLQDLLNVSKPDLDDEPYQRMSLCVELDALLNLFQDKMYKIRVERKYEDVELEIMGRKNQLKRAIFNVIKNAFESIQDKGTVVVRHRLDVDGKHVQIVISDTGSGIPKEKLMLLGTPFFSTKSEGTGMGLVQVFSTIYQHGGTIDVDSVESQGTTFRIRVPIEISRVTGVVELDLVYHSEMSLEEFMLHNKEVFEESLLDEAVNLRELLVDIKTIGNIDLLQNAHKLVIYLIRNQHYEIMNFAKEEGELWAKQPSLNLSVKLEWFQSIRQVLWSFLYNFDRLSGAAVTRESYYSQERQINSMLDIFLRQFVVSYTTIKDELIQAHKEMIDDLSVPIIPLSSSISILPLLGAVDAHRAKMIREKVLEQIGKLQIQTLLIDMSGVAFLDATVADHLFKILNGIGFMGCNAVITGIRPEIANTMVELGIQFNDRIKTKATLQQAFEEINSSAML
ncbi:ATP-binding protein [Paenibacillus allorhizosphaerae]|uniref:Adaptive-response sensory-kinase SasA n=1 Tax=Paenibacillus allorhizosphaerae TaxID=2849866 RepID=A0ABM8VN25_9BACL|nr:ATP-binding protein [Paenibacillus allorhizosphaerae]CAG7650499.1 Adaptive-response sensory-kinase SasA [Paenibacillus allorhizosphaerae]